MEARSSLWFYWGGRESSLGFWLDLLVWYRTSESFLLRPGLVWLGIHNSGMYTFICRPFCS